MCIKSSLIAVAAIALSLSGHAQSQSDPPMPMQGMDHSNMDHAAHMAAMAKAQRHAQVSELGKDVMPFDLSATLHVFTKDAEGGTQQVVARDKSDAKQTELARGHLKEIRGQFLRGDFSGPTHIHGSQMPGLAELAAAKTGSIAIRYKDVEGGAQLSFKTTAPNLVAAIHNWFDAQVSDHGKDAVEGHAH
jgi:hypothetical protein